MCDAHGYVSCVVCDVCAKMCDPCSKHQGSENKAILECACAQGGCDRCNFDTIHHDHGPRSMRVSESVCLEHRHAPDRAGATKMQGVSQAYKSRLTSIARVCASRVRSYTTMAPGASGQPGDRVAAAIHEAHNRGQPPITWLSTRSRSAALSVAPSTGAVLVHDVLLGDLSCLACLLLAEARFERRSVRCSSSRRLAHRLIGR